MLHEQPMTPSSLESNGLCEKKHASAGTSLPPTISDLPRNAYSIYHDHMLQPWNLSTPSTHKPRSMIDPTPAPPLYTSRLIFKCAHAHRSLASHNSAEARVEARVSSVDGRSACCAASSVRAAGACGVRCRRQGSGVMESGRRVYCCGSDVAETYWWAGWAWVVVRRGVDDGLVSGGASCA